MLRDFAVSYSTAPRDIPFDPNIDTAETYKEKIRELLLQNFFPTAVAAYLAHKASEGEALRGEELAVCPLPTSDEFRPDGTLKEAVEWMTNALLEIRPWIADFDWLFAGDRSDGPITKQAEKHTHEKLAEYFMIVSRFSSEIWDSARTLFAVHGQRLVEEWIRNGETREPSLEDLNFDHFFWELDPSNPDQLWPSEQREIYRKLANQVDEVIIESWAKPFKRGIDDPRQFSPVTGIDPRFDLDPGQSIDPNLLTRKTLYHFVKLMCDEGDDWNDVVENGKITKHSRRALPRNPVNGVIDFSIHHGAKYAPLLIDRALVQPFCIDADARQWRLGCHLAAQKTLWDIASRNRARRFLSSLASTS